MRRRGNKAGLAIFALVDIVLIAGIVLFVRKTDLMEQTGETAPAAVTGSSEASVPPAVTVPEMMLSFNRDDGITMEELEALQEAMSVMHAKDAEDAFSAAESRFPDAEELMSAMENAEADSGLSGAESAAAEPVPLSELPPTKRCLVDGTFWEGCPPRDIQLLTPNEFSRPQYALDEVHDIVIHYVGNPGTTAQQNRDYFESLKDGSYSASSHFVIGLEGEIIQCISCSEWAYCSNSRNYDTIAIECCHPDATGKFNSATYRSVVELTAWLCKAFEIGPSHVIRHYDVTGKHCPKYYVETEGAWDQMLADIKAQYDLIAGE